MRLILLACLTLLSAFSFAAKETKDKKAVLLKIDFKFKNEKKSLQLKNDSILAHDNHNWTPLAPSQDGVVLLGKIQKPEKGTLTSEFMVIDSSVTPVAIRQMKVISLLNEPASITTANDKEEITVAVTAEPTTYQQVTK